MAIPTTKVTVPSYLRNAPNGQLVGSDLRSWDGSTRVDFKLFVPVSYAMQAMHLAAEADGFHLWTTGRYRPLSQQVSLFRSRFSPNEDDGNGYKWWDSNGDGTAERWYLQDNPATGRPYANAATPGTSNHGWALADDIAERRGNEVVSLTKAGLGWLEANAVGFGWGIETYKEIWHWHWIGGDRLTPLTVETLALHGIIVLDLSGFGFTIPTPPPPPEEDDMGKLFLARSTENRYHLRRGDGNIATVLRSNEYAHAAVLFNADREPNFYNPLTGARLNSWSEIPELNETQLDLWVGYPAYEITLPDEG